MTDRRPDAGGRARHELDVHHLRSRGSVTAETAVLLPSLLGLLGIMLWLVLVVTAQLQTVDAARVGARAAARGESVEQATVVAQQAAPPGAQVVAHRSGSEVVVEVTVDLAPPGGLPVLPSVTVSASAVAHAEDADGWSR